MKSNGFNCVTRNEDKNEDNAEADKDEGEDGNEDQDIDTSYHILSHPMIIYIPGRSIRMCIHH